jgi:2-C-methyl-D-erythritol 4-phosphate cytidylyltransferase
LLHSLEVFLNMEEVAEAVVVVHPEDRTEVGRWVPTLGQGARTRVVPGGAERSDSVREGLRVLGGGTEWVAIHDAARPLVSAGLLRRVWRAAIEKGAAVPAVRATDSVRRDDEGGGTRSLDREGLWLVQTPQVFRCGLIRGAYDAYDRGGGGRAGATDDAQLVEAIGGEVAVVPSEPWNIKVTFEHDLKIVEALLEGGREFF